MPLIDMPLEKLRQYQGTNLCPADFDAYWNKALDEMKSIAPQVELVRSTFTAPDAECFDLYFTGVNSARIHAKYLRPTRTAKAPCVLMFHGYSGDAGDWWDKLAYVNMGFAVAALDCRGQGGYSEDTGGVKGPTLKGQIVRGLQDCPEKLLFRSIFLDTAQLAEIVAGFDEIDETRIAAVGGSQGGGLTVACAALSPRIKAAAPTYPFLSDYRRVWEMDLAKDAYDEIRDYFRHYDPRHEHEDEIFNTLGYIDIQHLAARIQAEILWGIGLMDTVCPPSTQFAAYNKITAKKEMMIYPDFGHEWLPGFNDAVYQFIVRAFG